MRPRRCTQHNVQRIHGGIETIIQNRYRCLYLCQCAFCLANLIFRSQPFAVQQLNFFQQLLLRDDLFIRNIQTGL
jgi:hypothetical protein